jgi:hypothetical protein
MNAIALAIEKRSHRIGLPPDWGWMDDDADWGVAVGF